MERQAERQAKTTMVHAYSIQCSVTVFAVETIVRYVSVDERRLESYTTQPRDITSKLIIILPTRCMPSSENNATATKHALTYSHPFLHFRHFGR